MMMQQQWMMLNKARSKNAEFNSIKAYFCLCLVFLLFRAIHFHNTTVCNEQCALCSSTQQAACKEVTFFVIFQHNMHKILQIVHNQYFDKKICKQLSVQVCAAMFTKRLLTHSSSSSLARNQLRLNTVCALQRVQKLSIFGNFAQFSLLARCTIQRVMYITGHISCFHTHLYWYVPAIWGTWLLTQKLMLSILAVKGGRKRDGEDLDTLGSIATCW